MIPQYNENWTEEDNKNAMLQGWNLFNAYTTKGEELQLQRIDEPEWLNGIPVFQSDEEAWKFVWEESLKGDKTCINALARLVLENPEEAIKIKESLGV